MASCDLSLGAPPKDLDTHGTLRQHQMNKRPGESGASLDCPTSLAQLKPACAINGGDMSAAR
eukprot:5604207-Amphidinium_carterae.1